MNTVTMNNLKSPMPTGPNAKACTLKDLTHERWDAYGGRLHPSPFHIKRADMHLDMTHLRSTNAPDILDTIREYQLSAYIADFYPHLIKGAQADLPSYNYDAPYTSPQAYDDGWWERSWASSSPSNSLDFLSSPLGHVFMRCEYPLAESVGRPPTLRDVVLHSSYGNQHEYVTWLSVPDLREPSPSYFLPAVKYAGFGSQGTYVLVSVRQAAGGDTTRNIPRELYVLFGPSLSGDACDVLAVHAVSRALASKVPAGTPSPWHPLAHATTHFHRHLTWYTLQSFLFDDLYNIPGVHDAHVSLSSALTELGYVLY